MYLILHFQSGGECLRAYVSVSPEQICQFADSEGKTGLWYMVQVRYNSCCTAKVCQYGKEIINKIILQSYISVKCNNTG